MYTIGSLRPVLPISYCTTVFFGSFIIQLLIWLCRATRTSILEKGLVISVALLDEIRGINLGQISFRRHASVYGCRSVVVEH